MASELEAHFPTRFSGAESEKLLYYQQQQKRLLAQCAWLRTEEPSYLATVAEVDAWMLEQMKPQIFDDGDVRNVLTQNRRRFGQLCAALSTMGYPRPQELDVFSFHSAVDFVNSKSQKSN